MTASLNCLINNPNLSHADDERLIRGRHPVPVARLAVVVFAMRADAQFKMFLSTERCLTAVIRLLNANRRERYG